RRTRAVRRLLPGGRERRPDRVPGRHPAGPAADELRHDEQRQLPARPSQAGRFTGEGAPAALPGDPVAAADRRGEPEIAGLRREARHPQGLRRYLLGAAELERVHGESLRPPRERHITPDNTKRTTDYTDNTDG